MTTIALLAVLNASGAAATSARTKLEAMGFANRAPIGAKRKNRKMIFNAERHKQKTRKEKDKMKNEEKYKTKEERSKAFSKFCGSHANCGSCKVSGHKNCSFYWLELEADEEDPLPCPFCGGKMKILNYPVLGDRYYLMCQECLCRTRAYPKTDEAVANHNRVAQAVAKANGSGDDY